MGLRFLPWFCLGLALVTATSADARRGRAAPAPSGPLRVVVIPFEAEGAIQYELPQALELELELLETVLVVGNARTWAELRKQGAKKFDRKRLQKVLQRRGVDVLIRGVQGYSVDGDAVLHLILYGNDGVPRFQGAVPMSTDIDGLARQVVDAVRDPIARFARLSAIEPSFPGKPSPAAMKKKSDDDLFVDFEEKEKRSAKEAARAPPPDEEPPPRASRVAPAEDPSDDDEPDEPPRRGRRLADDDAPPPARAAARDDDWDDEEPKATPARRADDDDPRAEDDGAKRKKLSFDDDDEPDRARRRSLAEPSRGRERTMADVVDDEKAAATDKALTHLFSASVGGGGGFWLYDFAANKPAQTSGFSAPFYPGGGFRADLWPIEWVGVDVDASLGYVSFSVDDPNAPVLPKQFAAFRYAAGVAAKGRYVLKLGTFAVGGGGRLGYRLLGVSVETQTHVDDNDLFTIVPGYMLHALTVGGEAYGAAVFLDRRLEVELKLDGLPLTRYAETPDNPGAQSLAFGWTTALTVRMEIFFGAFVEGFVFHSGTFASFDGVGDRRGALLDANTGERERIQGGRVLTVDASYGLAVGWMW